MRTFISILIFVLIVFLYLHVIHQFKKSEDLEIYEMDYVNHGHLQEVCDVRQPVLFDFMLEGNENLNIENIAKTHGSYECKIKDTHDYWNTESVDYVVFPLQTAHKLFINDAKSHYYTENNEIMMEDSGLAKPLQDVDEFLKPRFCAQTKYDVLAGSDGVGLPLRYHLNYRYFLMVTSGKIQVKMTPWKSRKYLHTIKDYENFEFRSPINVWNPQKQYRDDMEKLRFVDFEVHAGQVLYIPPYWWYSLKFSKHTTICAITYNSVMNVVAHSPYWGMYFVQQQNIKKKMAKTLDLEQFSTMDDKDKEGKDTGEQIQKHMENDHNIVVNVL